MPTNLPRNLFLFCGAMFISKLRQRVYFLLRSVVNRICWKDRSEQVNCEHVIGIDVLSRVRVQVAGAM